MQKYALIVKHEDAWNTKTIGTLRAVLFEAEHLLAFGMSVQIVPIQGGR